VVVHEKGAVLRGPRDLTSRIGPGNMNKLPWSDLPLLVVRDGVCSFFENSTVCRNVSAMFVL
jgi:hypothetical protein